MIFGLSFAVFLTLILVPIMYFTTYRFNKAAAEGKMFRNPFSFEGRIRRTEFGITVAIFFVVFIVLNMLLGGNSPTIMAQTAHSIFNIGLLWFLVAQMVKRFHDMGKNWWWILFLLIPIWNLYVLALLFFKPTNNEADKYGDNPRPALAEVIPGSLNAELPTA
jgi:uncharacterized membrane protein YhaH (DUF805 family)